MRWLKQQLQAWHRWLGVVLAVPIVLWFVSGAILLFVPFPRLLESERLAGLPTLALVQVRVGVDEATHVAGIEGVPASARLGMSGQVPVWRLRDDAGNAYVIDAIRGAHVEPVQADEALAIARAFQFQAVGRAGLPIDEGLIERDQWTINGLRGLQPPLHRLRFEDGRVLYVSRASREVVRDASRAERVWGWPGAVLHWIYVTPLRGNGALWTQVVLWLSGVSLLVAASGFAIGAWRSVDAWRRSRRISAYRGVHYWHHVLGWIGGGLVLTWLFSGFMSMSPFDPPRNDALAQWRQAWSQRAPAWPLPMHGWPVPIAGAHDELVEVELTWLSGEPWFRHLLRDGSVRWQALDARHRATAPDIASAIARASAASGHAVRGQHLLQAEDVHYAGHPHRDPRVLPVLRLQLDDAARSWVHVSPVRGEIVGMSDRASRLDRWLYNGLHSWDVPWLLQRPWLRHGLLLAGLMLGLSLSLTGFVVGWKRLRIVAISRRVATRVRVGSDQSHDASGGSGTEPQHH